MIGVLGPPIVVTARGTCSVGGLAGRLLVALAAADAPVDVKRLTEILWRDEPPATARAALHVHLGRVRRALAGCEGGTELVERTDVGYRLRPGTWQLDADLAAERAAQAGALLDQDADRALAAARASLQLWRGPAFSVGGEVVAPVAAQRAGALRLEVEELEVAALLAAGRAGEAERVALRMVEEEPYREPRWAQLLRARYQSGQVRQALATYQDARRVLVEDLGVEPGPLLRDLERAVLTHDEAVLIDRRTPPPPAGLPGPARTGPVFGRERDLDRCGAALAEGRPVVIYGAPGVGKTTLASELAHQHDAGSVLWVDLRNHSSGAHALAELIGEPHGAGAAWTRTGAARLIVLDNAEDLACVAVDLVPRLSRMAPGVGLVITSRTRIAVDAVFVPLGPLPVPDDGATAGEIERSPAVLLLRAALADVAPHVDLDAQHAVALCRKSGGMPLALRLTAAAARAVPITELATTSDPTIRHELLPAVEATIGLIDPTSRVAFLRLGIVREDFDVGLAAAVTGLDPEQVTVVLTALGDHGLLEISPEGVAPFSLLEPVRDAAEQLLDRSGQSAAAWDGLVGWSLQRAGHLRQMTLEHGRAGSGRVDVARELPHFRRVMDKLVADGDDKRALRLAQLLDVPLYLTGLWPERNRLLDRALSIPGRPSRARALILGCGARSGPLSRMDPERLEAALDMADAVGADGVAAYVRHLRGIHRWWEGDLAGSVADHEEAATWFEARGDATAIEVRKYQGLALVHDGDARGLDMLRRATDTYRRGGSKALFAHTLAFLGHCHRFLGDDDAALADWHESLEVLMLFRNTATAVHVELGLGELAVERADGRSGARHASGALRQIASSGNTEYEVWGWTVAMRAADEVGDLERALGCARSGIAALDHVVPGEAGRLAGELGVVAAAQGSWHHAARLFGCAAALGSRRELPFPAPSEAARWAAAAQDVRSALAAEAVLHEADGRRCTVGEAAGSFILAP